MKQTSVIVCPPGVEHPLSKLEGTNHADSNQNLVVNPELLFRLSQNIDNHCKNNVGNHVIESKYVPGASAKEVI